MLHRNRATSPLPQDTGMMETETLTSTSYSVRQSQVQQSQHNREALMGDVDVDAIDEERLRLSPNNHDNMDQSDSHKRTFEEIEREENFSLEEDTLSLLYLCPLYSITFYVSLSVFLLQMFILMLILADLTRDAPRYPEVVFFPLHAPIDVDNQVVIAQFLSLLIATVKEEDIFYSLKAIVIVGHDERVCHRFPGASEFKWWLANFFRFVTGIGNIMVSFFFIVGSDSVLDIFEGFAAMEFVSYIDNIIFNLAKWGYMGKPLQRLTIRVESVSMENRREKNQYWVALTVTFLCLTLVPLITFWSKVRVAQNTGFYLNHTISASVHVRFGDEAFELPPTIFNLTQSTRNLTAFNQEFPPTLQYAHFSGSYKVSFNDDWTLDRHAKRPIYFERDAVICKHEPTCGMFYYCEGLQTWVYTIPALGTARKELDKCEWGWLAQSEQTEVFSLEEVNDGRWKVYTGVMAETTINIKSDSCALDSDCSLNGVCVNGECECNDDWQGRHCEIRNPFCPALVFVDYGSNSYDFRFVQTFELAETRVYERPVYFRTSEVADTVCSNKIQYELYMFAGRRWYLSMWCTQDLARYVVDGVLTMEENLHAFWDNTLAMDLKWYSELTESYTGTGLGMLEIRDSYSTGSSLGSFGVAFPSGGTFECMDAPCANDRNICGRKGTCVDYNWTTPITNVSKVWHICKCKHFYGGPYCQFNPYEEYTRDHFKQYLDNPTAVKNDYQRRYWDPWLEELGNSTSPSNAVVFDVSNTGNFDPTIAPTLSPTTLPDNATSGSSDALPYNATSESPTNGLPLVSTMSSNATDYNATTEAPTTPSFAIQVIVNGSMAPTDDNIFHNESSVRT